MNAETGLNESGLIDILAQAGTPGWVSFWTTMFFIAVGLWGLKKKFRPSSCRAFTLLALLPAVVGFYGASHLRAVFRTREGHFEAETLAGFFYSGEVALPLAVGFLGSFVLMFLAFMLWVRSDEEVIEG